MPRQWYKKFDSFIMSQEYKRTFADPCVYVWRFHDDKFIILLLYVDDMLIMGQDADMIHKLKRELSKTFDMKDLGNTNRILGMEILRDRKAYKLWLSHEIYIERILERFNMKNSKLVYTPLASHFKQHKEFFYSPFLLRTCNRRRLIFQKRCSGWCLSNRSSK